MFRTWDGFTGLRAQPTAELHFEDMRVPDEWRLGPVGKGLGIALETLIKGRLSVAAGCVGIGEASLRVATSYAGERTQFGRLIAGFQLVQELLADISTDVAAARMLVWRAADLIDNGAPFDVACSQAKLFASEAAFRAANSAVQVFGGYGYIDEFPVAKYLRDARVMSLYEGTSQIQKLLIGRALTGISAF